MSFRPIRYALRVHFQLSSNPPQVHAVHIQLNGLLADLRTVAVRFLQRGVFAAAPITPISLTARPGLANLVLLVTAPTLWTFHAPILPTMLGTPRGIACGHFLQLAV